MMHLLRPSNVAAFALFSLTLLIAGCGTDPYGGMALLPVSGKVTLDDGQPLTGGMVTFVSKDPKVFTSPTGPIGKDGSYSLFYGKSPGAPAGNYKVLVMTNMPMMGTEMPKEGSLPQLAPKYGSVDATDLSVDVTGSAKPGQYDLKVSRAGAP